MYSASASEFERSALAVSVGLPLLLPADLLSESDLDTPFTCGLKLP